MPATIEEIREAFLQCEKIISQDANKAGITMAICDPKADSQPRKLSHLLWLSREGLKLVEDKQREQAMCWLAFIQGAISWGMGLCPIEELKLRPDDLG